MRTWERIATLLASLALIPLAYLPSAAAQPSPAAASDSTQPVQLIAGLDPQLIDQGANPCVDFAAYAWGNFNKLYPKQDGYTPIQQFFVAYGQNWRGSIRPQQVRLQVQTDPHSPRQFRVDGVVQNMPEFGRAFGCTSGQPMMPVNACRVW
jgi:predicted metalloendopeptidase